MAAIPVARAALLRRYWPPLALIAGTGLLVCLGTAFGSDEVQVTMTEMLIRMVVVVGMYLFIGNSGILSFGHVGFMCIGAYAAAWATVDPNWKQLMLADLPAILQQHQYPFLPSVLGGGVLAALVALLLGVAIMRLSGIAGSIATFSFLAIVNSVYSNWESVTAGTSSIIGVPTVVGPWIAFAFAAAAILLTYMFQVSGVGLLLRASRDDEVAARSSGTNILKVRVIAFVASAAILGIGGGLYGHFLGILTTDTFYLSLTFITLAMLVVGGIGSLTGAVVGVLVVTVCVEVLRRMEGGFTVGTTMLRLPQGSEEIGLGVAMALILIFRPAGLTLSREVPWPRRRALDVPLRAADSVPLQADETTRL